MEEQNSFTLEIYQEAKALVAHLFNSGVHATFYDGHLAIWFEWCSKGGKTLICERATPGWQERAKERIPQNK